MTGQLKEMQAKIQKQRSEIGRLTHLTETLRKEKKELRADLAYWKEEAERLAQLVSK